MFINDCKNDFFLGTGTYTSCVYILDGKNSTTTPYIQIALIDLLSQNDKLDEVHIFLTEEARTKNWNGESGLHRNLVDSFDVARLTIKEHDIQFASEVDIIWDMFEKIIAVLEENDQVIFDITHSFRYQPMLALLALHFARVTKNIDVRGIYYGQYDPKAEGKCFPIIDLSSFVELQDWITNVYAFTKTGRADMLSEWLNEKDHSIRKRERKTTVDLKGVRELAKTWKSFTDALQTNRSLDVKEKAEEAIKSIQKVSNVDLRSAFKPLQGLFEKVENEIYSISEEDEIISGLAAIEWCYNHGLIQQAYTMVVELGVTTVCLKNDIGPRQKIRGDYSYLLTLAIKIEKGKASIEELHSEINDAKNIVNDLLQYPKLLRTLSDFINNRNDINHAGCRPEYLNAEKFFEHFVKWFPIYKQELLSFWKSSD